MKIHSSYMSVMTSDGEMEVYVSRPDGDLRFPALIVFQEAFGVNDHIKEVCQRFAREEATRHPRPAGEAPLRAR
jgi:carboxymethylenebutenolidase